MIPLRSRKPVVMLLALLLTVLSLAPVAGYHEGSDAEHEFSDAQFDDRWARTDLPVEQGEVERTWMWGLKPYTGGMMEPYADSTGDKRLVQYFDKSRMEINNPDAPDDELWFVTNGLLVVEMVDGRIQVGDDEFEDSQPADVPIAGDPDDQFGPTYADINDHGLRGEPAATVGTTLDMTVNDGTVGRDDAFAEHGVTAGYRVTVPGIDHTVASVFWDFMNLTGTVHEDGAYVEQDLFENPFYAVGYPITEAYWSEVEVAGTARDVLWQCFERRCLTYTPGNPEGFLVEAGNVGQHYYRWRHGDAQPETETVNIYLVEPGDATEPNGDATDGTFGCGDMIAPIEVQIDAQEDVAARITAGLTALLAYEHPELYNVFQNSDLTVADVQVNSDVAVVNLSGTLRLGGVCDEPRVQEQIEQTVLQFEEISRVVLLLNGGPVSDNPQLSELQGGVLATFDVSGEHFNLWTTNEETITDILALQTDPTLATFPNGPILRGPGEADHNGPWSWHLDPAATEMAEMTIEVCDGRPSYVEANVEEFVDTVGRYCPWSAELVEVQDLREPAP